MASITKDPPTLVQASWSKIAAYSPTDDKRKRSGPVAPADAATAKPSPLNQAPRVPNSAGRESKAERLSKSLQGERSSVDEKKEPTKPLQKFAPSGILRREESSKIVSNDDGYTHLSSDDSGKPPSFDTKSIASGTTFALDEKESLRPDDSASMRAAIEEEDMFSIAGSRVGSDLGKPFREQLQDIAYVGSIPQRGTLGAPYQSSALSILNSTSDSPQPIVNPLPLDATNLSGQSGASFIAFPPDEKLLEALQSQRDRVWVLKLEQDIIDFVGQSKEATLTLPQCNAFYRMLAHKLSDYYRLDHTVAQTATGSAVVISRTSFARIPPPLSGLPLSSTAADTPPLIPSARKIMRRPGDSRSENTTAANSEGPSASVSEIGADGDLHKPKSQLTREEREKQYAEVRERIFGKADLAESNEAGTTPEGMDESRSSSVNGKKKGVKKHRNLSNDDFEPRSQFPAYYPQSYSLNGYHGDQYFYPQYPPAAPNQNFQPMSPVQTGMPYQPLFAPMSPDVQTFSWCGTHPQAQHSRSAMASVQQSQANYDVSSHFQDAMQFQSARSRGSIPNRGPRSPNNSFLPTPVNTVPSDVLNSWQQPMYGSSAYLSQGMSSGPGSQYGYPQVPPYQGDSPQQMQAMHNRQHFNPQTQAFVPSAPNQRFMGILNGPAAYQHYNFDEHPHHQSMGSHQAAHRPYGSLMPVGGSPNQSQSHQKLSHRVVGTHCNNSNGPSFDAQSHMNVSNESKSIQDHTTDDKRVLEITAKFGMPSHLPARPPPPQTMEPHKYHEINRGHGGLHAYPGLSRSSPSGAGGNSV